MIEPLLPADVAVEDRQGSPCLVSRRFSDIYFAIADGLAETRLVFIEGNHLAERLPGRRHFTIAETGFGTGLNFLATLALIADMGRAAPRLTYIATELAPLDGEMIAKALASFPELALHRDALISRLPPRWPGRHRMLFHGGNVVLELLYGDSATMIRQAGFQADAWFLDGFAPAQNPEMWGDDLFSLIASRTAEKGTLASFTSAGHFRRGLESAGFSVQRLKGYGTKRHRITAEFNGKSASLTSQSGHVAVIGAGIAGASVAAGLKRRGYDVTVLGSGDGVADGASGNRIAVQAPRLTATDTFQARLSLTGYGYARRLARETGTSVADKTILYAWNEREQIRQEKITALGWPETVFRLVDTNTAGEITGHETHLGGMLFPEGGTVIPHQLVRCLLDGVTLRCGMVVRSMTKQLSGWRIDTDAGPVTCDIAVLAMGAGLPLVSCPQSGSLPRFQVTAGHVSYLPETALSPPLSGMSFGGYMAAMKEGGTALGASFDHHDPALPIPQLDASHHKSNLELLPIRMMASPDPDSHDWDGRTSLRLASPDRQPLAGKIDETLFVLTALGARGMVTGPLLGEFIASRIAGEPSPLDTGMEAVVDPLRFHGRGKS